MIAGNHQQTTEEWNKKMFKEIIDRSMVIQVLKCCTCGEIVAEIKYPDGPKLDEQTDMDKHASKTQHKSFNGLKIFIIYMCQADRDIMTELGEQQREAFNKFIESLKKP